MGKSKNKNSGSDFVAEFISDQKAKEKGIKSWKTGGPAGREAVGGLKGLQDYLSQSDDNSGLTLQKGEVNPFLPSVEGDTGPKDMYEYYASDTMPVLPKELRDQYDVVFAGTREFDPSEEVYNSKFGYNLADKTSNVWKFVPKSVAPVAEDSSTPAPIVDTNTYDRPVTVGTLSWVDPLKEAAGTEFLSNYIRSTGAPPVLS